MFNDIMKRIDYANMIGFLAGGLILLLVRAEYLIGFLVLAAGVLLIWSKVNRATIIYLVTYFIHLFFAGIIIYGHFINNEQTWSNYAFIGIAALAIAVMAFLVRTNTGTLSLFWLSLHILLIIQAFITPGSFMSDYWSINSIQQVFHSFYPLLIAVFLIGLFLDRFQTEIKREYSNK